jgi:hypothetical protein
MEIKDLLIAFNDGRLINDFTLFVFWGHKQQSLATKCWTINSIFYDDKLEELTIKFDDSSKITLISPMNFILSLDKIEIQEASSVTFEWVDRSLSGHNKLSHHHIMFVKEKQSILAKNNIHWSFIDTEHVAIKKPALIMAM